MYSVLAECNNACFVENEKNHIGSVNSKQRITLPLFELAHNDCGNNNNCTSSNANREVKNKVDFFNGKCRSVENCAKRKNKSCVDNVCTDDVTDGK